MSGDSLTIIDIELKSPYKVVAQAKSDTAQCTKCNHSDFSGRSLDLRCSAHRWLQSEKNAKLRAGKDSRAEASEGKRRRWKQG